MTIGLPVASTSKATSKSYATSARMVATVGVLIAVAAPMGVPFRANSADVWYVTVSYVADGIGDAAAPRRDDDGQRGGERTQAWTGAGRTGRNFSTGM